MLVEETSVRSGLRPVDPVLRAVLAEIKLGVRKRRAAAARVRISGLVVLASLVIGAGVAAVGGLASSPHPTSASLRVSAVRPPPVEPQRLLPLAPPDARALNARIPLVQGALPSALPFRFAGSPEARQRATDCLAAAAWYEAGDNPGGEQAVVQVVLNRVRHPAFPSTICGVVFQGSDRSTGCQFTFTCDGSLARIPSEEAWIRARALAGRALAGAVDERVGEATHYHADWVVPYWSSSLDKIAQIGPHIFYRWRGYWGKPAAFRRTGGGVEEPVIARLAAISTVHRPAQGDAGTLQASVAADAPAPPAAATSLPDPIALPGVRPKSLRGALVRGESANLFYIQVIADTFAGNYATAALAICKNKPRCTVLGWRDPGQMTTSLPLPAGNDRALTFYYHRDDSGGERALWNCDQVQRSNKSQCLPSDTNSLPGLSS